MTRSARAIPLSVLGADALRQIDHVLFAERERGKLRAEATASRATGQNPEDALQIASAEFLAAVLPPDAWACHIPNGGKRSKATAGKLKAMGVKAGAPDWLIVYGGRALFVELKSEKGKPSDAQNAVHAALTGAGCPVAVCRSIPEIETALRSWLLPLRGASQGFLK